MKPCAPTAAMKIILDPAYRWETQALGDELSVHRIGHAPPVAAIARHFTAADRPSAGELGAFLHDQVGALRGHS